jgi:hypothetical protein
MARRVRLLGVLTATLLVALLFARSDLTPAHATFPGDNGRIAYVFNDGSGDDIWTMNADGTDKKPLLAGISTPRDPRWSPDGSQILFWSEADQVHIIGADGNDLRTLTIEGDDPSWSPDGKKIAYRSRATGAQGIWVATLDGSAPPVMVQGDLNGHLVGPPAWSPDGQKIAFSGFTAVDQHGDGISDLYVVSATGGPPQQVTHVGAEEDSYNFPWTWFADGSRLLTHRNRDGASRLDIVSYPGGAITPLDTVTTQAVPSPDGSQLAFLDFSNSPNVQISVQDIVGGTPKPLGAAVTYSSFDWAPSAAIKIEFTQASQVLQSTSDLEQSVTQNGSPPIPLVAGKPAVMRVYFPAVIQPTDYLVHTNLTSYGARNDDIGVHLEPGCSATQRRDESNGCGAAEKFFVPPQGQFTVIVSIGIVSQQQVIYSHTFDFTSQKLDPLTIVTVGVCDSPISGNVWNCGQDYSFNPVGFLRSLAPTDRVSIVHSGTYIYRDMANSPDMTDWWYHVLLDVQAVRAANPHPFSGKVVYVGIVRSDIGGGTQSIVRPGGFAGAMLRDGITVFGNPATDVTLAQIAASAVGVHFTDTDAPLSSSAPGCDGTLFDAHTDWPSTDNGIQSTGFDVWQHMARKGSSTFDLMGDCWPVWISPHSYSKFLKALGGTLPPDAPAAVPSGGAWLVSGTIDGNSASLAPLVTLDTATDTTPGQGNYRIEVRGTGNAVLFTRNFDADAVIPKAPGGLPAGPGEFAEAIPVQAGAQRIVVLSGNTELGSIDLTGSAPAVAFDSQPAVGQPVSWTITDSDSSTFTSYLDYSRDGGSTWQEIAAGLPTTSLAVDFNRLGGSANAKLRVRVSDGALTGEAASNPFSVDEKGPSVRIASPIDGAVLRAGEVAEMQADAFDAEDGALTGSALQWSSSLDGSLGSGESLSLTGLSMGTHTITLTAHDSANHSATAQVTVTIWDADTVDGEINGDVDCDKAITVLDALTTLLFEAGTPRQQPAGCADLGSGSDPFGDVDCNNSINGADIVADLSFVAGRVQPPPAHCRPVGS